MFDAAELPPSSFFLTDLLPILFIVFLAVSILRARLPGRIAMGPLLALAAGMVHPCVLMLTAIYLAYRYRMEFYPEIDLLAFLGFYAAISSRRSLAVLHRYRGWMVAATLISVVSAHGTLVLYKLSEFGPSQRVMHGGLIDYYRSTFSKTFQ